MSSRRMYSKNQLIRLIEGHSEGKVQSVNGHTGEVTLDASDIKTTTTHTTLQANLERIDEALDGKLDASKSAVANVGGLVVPSSAPANTVLVGIETDREQAQINIGAGLSLQGATSPYTLNVTAQGFGIYDHAISIDCPGLLSACTFHILTTDPTPINSYVGITSVLTHGRAAQVTHGEGVFGSSGVSSGHIQIISGDAYFSYVKSDDTAQLIQPSDISGISDQVHTI